MNDTEATEAVVVYMVVFSVKAFDAAKSEVEKDVVEISHYMIIVKVPTKRF